MQTVPLKSQISDVHHGIQEIAAFCAEKGWVPATSGNFSMRYDLKRIAITVSGTDKGNLTPKDILFIDYDGHSLDVGVKPSAESLLHISLYSANPDIQAIAHVHSTNSTVLSKVYFEKGELVLEDLELLKALSGVKTHRHREVIPIFENNQNIPELVQQIEAYIENKPNDQAFHAYLIAGHGLYTWGRNTKEAMRHCEAFNALFDSLILEAKLKESSHEFGENI